jgi:uncharacterized membrane protein YhaH (DUF805 family)
MSWYFKVFANYFNFQGRARRKEYWYFLLFNLLVGICLGFVIGFVKVLVHIDIHMLKNLYLISILVPSASVAVRRIHDSGYSGWWVLCPIYNIALMFLNGENGPNRFGPDPKVDGDAANSKSSSFKAS